MRKLNVSIPNEIYKKFMIKLFIEDDLRGAPSRKLVKWMQMYVEGKLE